jgi:hypothetical protein
MANARPMAAWAIDAAGQRVLRDALYNCSLGVIPKGAHTGRECRVYARGVLVGVVAGLMAAGASFDMAWNAVKNLLPADFDRACLPAGWEM